MAGAGIFVNVVDITKALSTAGGLLYLFVGLFMFPLVFTFAKLVNIYPVGGFYAFARPMSPLLGFFSNWMYFFGKLASASLLLFVAANFLKQLLPSLLGHVDALLLSIGILAFFIYLNFLNVRIGAIIQNCFFAAKSVPMLLMIAIGVYCFDVNIISSLVDVSATTFMATLPLALYCFSGFESACSISRQMYNPEKNAPKAIFYSFFSIILLYVAFQTLVSMMLAPHIGSITTYTEAYPYFISLIPTTAWLQAKLTTLISFLIGFSAMGAAYGLLFSNSWNLFTLAQNKHTFAQQQISTLNKHGVPATAVLVEGLFCMFFLLATSGNKIQLLQISTLGCTMTYTISTIAFLHLNKWSNITGLLSLVTCSGFIVACVISSIQHNFIALHLFSFMVALGAVMYYWCKKNR